MTSVLDRGSVARTSPALAAAARAFDTLNDAQREAVAHGAHAPGQPAEPLLLIAGAGSGKTLTLAARIARLVLDGADPGRILLLSFSRRAAQELERRAGRLLHQALGWRSDQPAPPLPWAGTFHGVGARLLREHASRIGLAEAFTIHDRGDAEDLMGLVRHELGLDTTEARFPLKGTCLAIYSRTVNSQAALAEVLAQHFPWCAAWEDALRRLFGAYVEAKLAQQVLDYDDLLLHWAQVMAEPALAAAIGARFEHVLVDEYQDTNRLQAVILRALKPDGRGLTVVGDDAQAIYSFRAAEVRNILDFPRHFAQPARVLTLDRNYRSTQPLLAASNAVIALASERHAKQLWSDRESDERAALVTVADEAAQAGWVADRVLARREAGLALKRQAVLFRASHHSAGLELELTRRNIPFVKFGGLKFLEAAHVKDVLSLLRFAQNPRGRLAGLRAAQLVAGIGPAAARRLLDAMAAAPDPRAALQAHVPPPKAARAWRAFAELQAQLAANAVPWPGALQQAIAWYLPQLERLHDDHAARGADLAQLARLAAGHGSCERFLTELTLDPPELGAGEADVPLRDEDYLILSTIHSAKGQEWSAVYVLNVVDGCIPSDLGAGSPAELEEERRLLYVAMTRAKQHLDLVSPQRFYIPQQTAWGDRHVYAQPSRFLPAAVQACFERLEAPPRAVPGATADPEAALPRVDLAAGARALWR